MPIIRSKKRYKVDLPAQLILCEVNYHRLSQLLPDLSQQKVGNIRQYIVGHHAASESLLEITVVEQTKYTTVVHIVQYFSLQTYTPSIKKASTRFLLSGRAKSGINLSRVKLHSLLGNTQGQVETKSKVVVYRGDVRLYHDANVAEVVKCQRYQAFLPRYDYPNIDMHQVDEKVQMNRFLGELLAHCLSYGRVSEAVMIPLS